MTDFTLAGWSYNPLTGRYQSATFTEGEWIAVEGSFGAKVSPQTPIGEDFSAYANDAALIDSNWLEYQTNGGAVVKSFNLPHRANAKCAYSNWARGQFATSYRHYPVRTKRVFVSYWTRMVDNYTHDYGVWKPCRLTSSTRSLASGGGGGGGVYNGVGCFAYSNVRPQDVSGASGQTSFTPVDSGTPSNNNGGTVLGNTPYHATTVAGWVRMEGFVDLGTADTNNGRFYTRCGALSYQNYTNQVMSSSLRDFYLDTILLGLDFANPFLWIRINGAVVPNQDYTLTVAGTPYTVNSGATPLTNVQIIEALYAALVSAGYPTTGSGVFMSPDHTEIRVGDPNLGQIAHSFTPNMIYRAYGAAVSDLVVDYSRAQFYLTPTSTFDHATAEVLRYRAWTDGTRVELSRFGGQLFDGTKYLHFVNDTETPTLIGLR